MLIFPVLTDRTRETAALFGYLTAGATQAVAQACRAQKIQNCPCADSAAPTFTDDGDTIFTVCADNVQWATEFISEFLSTALTSVGEMCDQWNIDVGKKVGVVLLMLIRSVIVMLVFYCACGSVK